MGENSSSPGAAKERRTRLKLLTTLLQNPEGLRKEELRKEAEIKDIDTVTRHIEKSKPIGLVREVPNRRIQVTSAGIVEQHRLANTALLEERKYEPLTGYADTITVESGVVEITLSGKAVDIPTASERIRDKSEELCRWFEDLGIPEGHFILHWRRKKG